MDQTKQLVIVGDSAFAEIAYEYFNVDSPYQVVAFSVEQAYVKREMLFGYPVVPFEELEHCYSPDQHELFVAVVYTQLNRLRARLCDQAKKKGYRLATYVSSRSFLWRNVEIGEHCFIFEDNTVQPFVKLGNNVILWSGNHIGHHSVIQDNCFISSHVVISGFCEVGRNSFIGVNATVGNNIKIAEDNWIGPGVTILKDTQPNSFYRPGEAELAKVSSTRFFKVSD